MEWKSSIVNEGGLVKIPERWLHLHYYEGLNILFRFENSLRVFVYSVLKNEYFEKWTECNFSRGGEKTASIRSIAKRRVNQSNNFGYLGYDIEAPLMHLTSGELVELISSDAYWDKFKAYFKGNKEIIKNKLLEIGEVRNSLAHFRPIKIDDIELIKQNIRHTLMDVENCLESIFSQLNRVPTNTEGGWYKSFSNIGNQLISTSLFYSKDETWVKVKLAFNVPTLSKNKVSNTFWTYNVANFNTPNILEVHPVLTKYVTYTAESVEYPSLSKEYDLTILKNINLVFRKDILVNNHESISDQIKQILSKAVEECDLLKEDNLARGELIESVHANAIFLEKEGSVNHWNYNYDNLFVEYKSKDPSEYWGRQQYSNDIVAGSRRYPWMSADISQFEGFI